MNRVVLGIMLAVATLPIVGVGTGLAAEESAPFVIEEVRLPSRVDGVELYVQVGYRQRPGEDVIRRPVVIEQSPYGPGFGPEGYWLEGLDDDIAFVFLHQRGTGLSGGSWNTAGPLDQADFLQVIEWACSPDRAWSNGHAALNGGSASAITGYAAMRHPMPCVDAAVMWAGTSNMYRDGIAPGGIWNPTVSLVATGAVGLAQLRGIGPRTMHDPTTFPAYVRGFADAAANVQAHPLEDEFWRDRAFSERLVDPTFPLLTFTGLWDVTADAGIEGFIATRHLGSKLRITGAHDSEPDFEGRKDTMRRWFRHQLLGEANGIDGEPAVVAMVPNGGLEEFQAGNNEIRTGPKWPLPSTEFTRLHLRAGGQLDRALPGPTEPADTYATVPTNPWATDRNPTSAAGSGLLGNVVPAAVDLRSQPGALVYSTEPVTETVELLGPAVVELHASTMAPETDYLVVIADVDPDGHAEQLSTARIRSTFTGEVPGRHLVDQRSKEVVRPWNDFSTKEAVPRGEARRYRIEAGPIGDRVAPGHRIAIYVLGIGAGMTDRPVSTVNTVYHDALRPSAVVLPVVEGSLP